MSRLRNGVRGAALSAILLGLGGCAGSGGGSTYVTYGVGYGFYDPWYDRGDIIINPRPPVRPMPPVARPPIARPTPLPARPMPRPTPRLR